MSDDEDGDDYTILKAISRGALGSLRAILSRIPSSSRAAYILREGRQIGYPVPGLENARGSLFDAALLHQQSRILDYFVGGADGITPPPAYGAVTALIMGRDATAFRLLSEHPTVFDVNARSPSDGLAVLHVLAARTPPPAAAICAIATLPGVDVDVISKGGHSPLHLIARTCSDLTDGYNLASAFRAAGADLDSCDADGVTAAAVTLNAGLRRGLAFDLPARQRLMPRLPGTVEVDPVAPPGPPSAAGKGKGGGGAQQGGSTHASSTDAAPRVWSAGRPRVLTPISQTQRDRARDLARRGRSPASSSTGTTPRAGASAAR